MSRFDVFDLGPVVDAHVDVAIVDARSVHLLDGSLSGVGVSELNSSPTAAAARRLVPGDVGAERSVGRKHAHEKLLIGVPAQVSDVHRRASRLEIVHLLLPWLPRVVVSSAVEADVEGTSIDLGRVHELSESVVRFSFGSKVNETVSAAASSVLAGDLGADGVVRGKDVVEIDRGGGPGKISDKERRAARGSRVVVARRHGVLRASVVANKHLASSDIGVVEGGNRVIGGFLGVKGHETVSAAASVADRKSVV